MAFDSGFHRLMPHKFWIRSRVYHEPSKRWGTVVMVGPDEDIYGVELDLDMDEKYLLYPVRGDHLTKADDAAST